MTNKKKYRRLRYLIHKYDICPYLNLELIEYLDNKIQNLSGFDNIDKNVSKIRKAFIEIKKLTIELNISKEEYLKIAKEELRKKSIIQEYLKINTLKETRDNKGVYIGNGGSNVNTVRYPKKNRSKRTWKIFYEMFPWKSKNDEYNGKTSKRMKK